MSSNAEGSSSVMTGQQTLCGSPVIKMARDEDYHSISLADFEDILEDSLDDSVQPLQYINRDDFAWLKCHRPLYSIASVLGIEEESETPPSDRKLSVVTCNLTLDHENVGKEQDYQEHGFSSICTPRPIPPFPYTRSDAEEMTRNNKQLNSNRDGERTICTNEVSSSILVEWVDGRSLKSDFRLLSLAQCSYFLRCILDVGHDSSPWVVKPTAGDDDTNTQNNKDVAILILNRAALPEKLIDFRVSNVCPSWFLHAVGNVKNVNAKSVPWLGDRECSSVDSDCSGEASDGEAVMLIYRRLPGRLGLADKHPTTTQPVKMKGCLWETSVVAAKDGAPKVQYRVVGPPILNAKDEYPNLLEPLLKPDMLHAMQEESLQIGHWTAWPEQQHYKATSQSGEAPWNVFPLCYTFPAHDLTRRQWVQATCAAVPRTAQLIKEHLGDNLRTALFSRLDPESVLEAHTGWEDLANHVLRLHIPLVLPPGDLCGVWVDGCIELHRQGRALCFDDSKTHRAFNYSRESRIVLILDLVRPPDLPLGTATGGHSDELDEFIGKMGVAR